MFDLVVRNGLVINADSSQKADVGIVGETIVQIGQGLERGKQEIDATAAYVLPGGVDVHTHLDLELAGSQTADDFRSGTIAGLCGGTTSIIDFCVQLRGQSLGEALDIWHAKADGRALADYGFHMVVTDLTADVLRELSELPSQGITSFKLFMAYENAQVDDRTILQCLEVARNKGALVMVHAENGDAADYLIKKALSAGKTSPLQHALTRPPIVESEATARAIALAEVVGAPIYIVHLTCEGALDAVVAGRKRGVHVLAETCTQYLFCTTKDLDRPGLDGTKWIFTPPPRSRADQDHIWRAIGNGTLQVVSSDDASWPSSLKRKEDFSKVPNGVPGIGERMIMTYQGVNDGRLTLNRFVELVATNPARLFGLAPRKGAVVVGADADIVIWDPNAEATISQEHLKHAVDFTLYEGMKVKGMPKMVALRGSIVVKDGAYCGRGEGGKFLRREKFAID